MVSLRYEIFLSLLLLLNPIGVLSVVHVGEINQR